MAIIPSANVRPMSVYYSVQRNKQSLTLPSADACELVGTKKAKRQNLAGALAPAPGTDVSAIYVAKYNRFVDNILGRINKILRERYDPVTVKLTSPSTGSKSKSKSASKKSKKSKPKRRKSSKRRTAATKTTEPAAPRASEDLLLQEEPAAVQNVTSSTEPALSQLSTEVCSVALFLESFDPFDWRSVA